MKHTFQLALTTLLSAALLSQSMAAVSFTGIGEVTSIERDVIGDGLTYTEYGSETQQAYIFEYDPTGSVLPLVRYGDTVYGKDRLSSLSDAAWSDKKTVLGAVNGDFYSMQTGVPMGVMIDDGKLITSDDNKYAIGFTADGKAIIGKPQIRTAMVNLTRGSSMLNVDQLNKFPTQWGVYLLTEEFASTTLSTIESLEIVIRLDSKFKATGSVSGTVIDVIDGDCNNAIPKDCAVISIANINENYAKFASIAVGDKLRFDTVCASGWESVTTAIGGGDLILENGAMPENILDEDHETAANPRTAVGIKEDGKVVFFAVDGRQKTAKGLTETELSAVMRELGCTSALNLDGGGSTTVMVKHSTATETVCVNKPADVNYRAIANGILFVSKHAADGVFSAISALPNTPLLLAGSSLSFTAKPLDKAYMPAGLDIGSDKVTLSFADGTNYGPEAGSVSGSVYKAGSVPGEYRLKVTVPNGLDLISTEASVIVVDQLDSFEVTPTYAKVKPGSLVKLNISAKSGENSLIATKDSFHYTLNGTHVEANQKDYPGAWLLCDIGYLDMNGNFQTFGNTEGEVDIEITYGDMVQKVHIDSSTKSDRISDFEKGEDVGKFRLSAEGSELYLAPSTSGYKSAGALEIGFSYHTAATKRLLDLKLREEFPIAPSAESIKMWVRGDISSPLSAIVADESGNEYMLSYKVSKDYSRQLGWRELTAVIPDSLKIGQLSLRSLLVINGSGEAEKTITVDDAIVYYGAPDVPVLQIGEHWGANGIHLLFDMGVIQLYDCETVNDAPTIDPDKLLTRADFAKIMSLWMGYNAMEYLEGIPLEADTPYDKAPYIRAVIDKGLMSGRDKDATGAVIFDANARITREEAFKVLGTLVSQADDGLISFTDAEDISEWALSGVRKMVKAGLISGYAEDNTIRPKAQISLAELAALLSKM